MDALYDLYAESGADYVNNVEPRTFPHGLDCEVFSFDVLDQAHKKAVDVREREHVTPWIRENPHIVRRHLISGAEDLATLRWTLDYPADLAFFRKLMSEMDDAASAGYHEIAAFLAQRPDIAALNALEKINQP